MEVVRDLGQYVSKKKVGGSFSENIVLVFVYVLDRKKLLQVSHPRLTTNRLVKI